VSEPKQITLPERETYLAGAILKALRKWKADNDRTPHRLWIVTDTDLDCLEAWAIDLWETHQKSQDALRRDGFEITFQPSSLQ